MVTNPGTATTEVVRMQQTGKISANEAVVLLGDIVDDVVQETFAQEEEMKKQESKDNSDLNSLKNKLKKLEELPKPQNKD